MRFKDQLLRCGACGTQFVYTVREQRRRAEKGLPLDAPAFCEDCRGADVRLAEADTSAAGPPEEGPTPVVSRRTGRRSDGQSKSRPKDSQRRARSSRPRNEKGSPPKKRTRRAEAKGRRRGGRPRRRRPRQRQTELRIRYLGTVKWFDVERGFGFIAQDDGEEVFVHCSAILMDGKRYLEQGQPVEYEIEQTERGLQAVDVVPLA